MKNSVKKEGKTKMNRTDHTCYDYLSDQVAKYKTIKEHKA